MTAGPDDDILSLIEDGPEEAADPGARHWKVMIVDDDQDVHDTTVFALSRTPILGRPLRFIHAYSAADAEQQLRQETGIAVILLDVVMEREDAGLHLVKVIRDVLKISEVRIILRTGQPGYAPEMDAIRDYDINDYKTKSELSRNRIYTTLTAAIRCYEQIHAINASRRGLGLIIHASGELMAQQGMLNFAAGIITQISGLLGQPSEGIVCARNGDEPQAGTRIVAAIGRFAGSSGQPLSALGRPAVEKSIQSALAERRNLFSEAATTLFFPGASGCDMAAHIETDAPLTEVDHQLLQVFCTNITIGLDNVRLFEELSDLAYNDKLLRIPNRIAFLRLLDLSMTGERGPHAVMLVDIDHFSELNDALGHDYGDRLLQAVSSRLQQCLAGPMVIARVAADTFGILGTDASSLPDTLLALFREPFEIDGTARTISATIGIARLREVSGLGGDALRAANLALGHAKQGARSEARYFHPDMETETRNRVRLLQELRSAFAQHRLFLCYQPQISLATRKVIGVEALMRWRTDDGRFVSPAQFIPLAENSGLIISLGEWAMRTACNAARRFRQEGVENLRMAVNVSVAQFRHPGFLDVIDSALADSGIDSSLLELEITESVAMLDVEFMAGMLDRIKSRGIKIAIDDFGTGFSSLSYLERLNVDRLKIDRSFVNQMSQGDSAMRIVETVVQLARSLDLEIIAEGVEHAAEAGILARLGCHEAQGFLYSKGLEADDLLKFLRAPA